MPEKIVENLENEKSLILKKMDGPVFRWDIFKDFPEISAGFTTRYSSSKESLKPDKLNPFDFFNLGLHVEDDPVKVINSRNKLCSYLNFDFNGYTCSNQIHSDRVIYVDNRLKGRGKADFSDAISECDALFTDKKGILLNIFIADCVPVVLYDPINSCCAAIHAGWRGVAGNIITKTLDAMVSGFKTDPANVLAGIGPSIGKCCFDVGEDTAEEILQSGYYSDSVSEKREGKIFFDLRQCLKEKLTQYGVMKKSIEIIPYCTKCHSDIFYSYRASGGKTGRFSAFIGLQ